MSLLEKGKIYKNKADGFLYKVDFVCHNANDTFSVGIAGPYDVKTGDAREDARRDILKITREEMEKYEPFEFPEEESKDDGLNPGDVIMGILFGGKGFREDMIKYVKAEKLKNFKNDIVRVVEDKKNGKVSVTFKNGDKTESVCKEGDDYDFRIGFANCILMEITGNYSGFCRKLKKSKKFISVDELRAQKENTKKASKAKKAGKKSTSSKAAQGYNPETGKFEDK